MIGENTSVSIFGPYRFQEGFFLSAKEQHVKDKMRSLLPILLSYLHFLR